MTKSRIGILILLVVAYMGYRGQLPVTSNAPSPPTPTETPTVFVLQQAQATGESYPVGDGPGNIPVNQKWAVQGEYWLTPTPGPTPTPFVADALSVKLAEFSERYSDIPNSATFPPETWQQWPCAAKPGWPASHYRWCPLVTYFAQKANNGLWDINPDVLLGYMKFECPTGEPDCQNPTSAATGLCQVMPSGDPRSLQYTNASGVPYFATRPTVSQLEDPVFNLAFCARLVGGYIVAENSERDGFRRLGHQYADDPYKETRTIQQNVITYAGYDPWP